MGLYLVRLLASQRLDGREEVPSVLLPHSLTGSVSTLRYAMARLNFYFEKKDEYLGLAV